MSNLQNIYNESDNYSSNLISTRYDARIDESSFWTHREIEYNNTGLPILKLYKGETKRVYKYIYMNGVKCDLQFNGKLQLDPLDNVVNDTRICEIVSNTNETWITIKGINAGTYVVANDVMGILDPVLYPNVNDTDLLVIVEDEPKINNLSWDIDNPIVVNNRENIYFNVVISYDNGQCEYVSYDKLQQFKLLSTNPHAAIPICNLNESYIQINNLDEICQITINNDFEKIFGQTIPDLEPLTVIISNNISSDLLLSSKFYIEYENNVPLLNVNTTYNVTIWGIYDLIDGRQLRYNIDDIYVFSSNDENIITTNINNNTIYSKNVGITTIVATNKYEIDIRSLIPTTITWDVNVVKTLQSIDWNIDKTELHIGTDIATIFVKAIYDDGTEEDISNQCSFKYDETYIKVEENKITPLIPGYVDISILSAINVNDINIDKIITLNIIKDIEKIEIIDENNTVLNNTELELRVGDEKELNYLIYPSDATLQNMIWSSTDSSVILVDETGHIKVLKDGYATIYVGIKSEEKEILENTEIPDEPSEVTKEDIVASYNSIYAKLGITGYSIKATGIKLSQEEITLSIDDVECYYEVHIEPENATNKEIKTTFISDTRGWPISLYDNQTGFGILSAGSGILRVALVDNPELYDEMKVTIIDTRVKKVTIEDGNDSDYEWYDNYIISPETKFNDSGITKHERWDDDDFSRFYVPVNNSLQLNASVYPSNASNSNLQWYSSDNSLVKVDQNYGIITGLRNGIRQLEMYGDDGTNDNSRFPNTVWVTATNKKGEKSGICHVRVTRNNITNISIGESVAHDYDIDLFNSSGKQVVHGTDYDYDYVMYLGDELIIPVTLSVQDPNFGPSNNIEWFASDNTNIMSNIDNDGIIELVDEKVNHDNARNENFDWTNNDASSVNINKKNLNVKIKAIRLGEVSIHAEVEDNEPYYVASTVQMTTTKVYHDEVYPSGYAIFDDYKVFIAYCGEQGSGVNKVNESYSLLDGVTVTLTTDKKFIIDVPITYDISGNERYVSKRVSELTDKKPNYIYVKITDSDDKPIEGMTAVIHAYSGPNTIKQTVDKSNADGELQCPSKTEHLYSDIEANKIIVNNAYPGHGEWRTVDKSRDINIRVVSTPDDIILTFRNTGRVLNNNLTKYKLQSVWKENDRIKIKRHNSKTTPLFILFSEKFDELLSESKDINGRLKLDDKYMSFAWFSSNPDIFTIEERKEDDPIVPTLNGCHTKCGYGRYMNIVAHGLGNAKLTIVNIMSGQTWERMIEVVE